MGEQQSVCQRGKSQLLATGDCTGTAKQLPIISAAMWGLQKPHIRSLTPSDEAQAIPLFLHYFTVEDSSSGHAVMSFMPSLIPTADHDALSAAVASVGYALLANITKSRDRSIMARRKYGVAMQIVRNTLGRTAPEETCRVLRVVVLLGFFEVCIPD